MASVKKPKVKGKNRLRVGSSYPSVAICKTWDRAWRTPFQIGGKAGQNSQAKNRD